MVNKEKVSYEKPSCLLLSHSFLSGLLSISPSSGEPLRPTNTSQMVLLNPVTITTGALGLSIYLCFVIKD